jgi:altronate dehydratase
MKPDHIILSPEDDVAIALADLPAGSVVAGVTLLSAVPHGHKFARHKIAEGAAVRRYGQIIGQASQPIAAGAHVHVQNLGGPFRAIAAPMAARERGTIWGC